MRDGLPHFRRPFTGGAIINRIRQSLWVVVVVVLAGCAPAAREGPYARVQVAGLTEPVRIVRDRTGISHIYARNTHDLFFAQGYNAARDRLWQLDLWRRRGEGKMAEQFGPRFVAQD